MTDDAPPRPDPGTKLVLARDLARATPRSFVHVDRHGQVRSPARYRAIEATAYGVMGALTVTVTVVYGLAFGLPGVAIGFGLAAMFAFSVRRVRRLRRASRLIVADRLDDAEALLAELLRGRLPRRLRALAEQNLAACHLRRGRFEEGLAHQREALRLYGPRGRGRPLAQVVAYGELLTLVNLGRVAEARALLDARHPTVPTGDYLRLHHWVAELYVAFGEGRHALDADALHARARVALGVTAAAVLLALLAWAHLLAGDRDQAWHLLREAYDRRDGVPIERTTPPLWAWMEAHRAEAEAAVEPDPYAALTSGSS